MGKKEPIVNHGLLQNTVNYKGLIEAQAKTPAYMGEVAPEPKPKVKTLTGRKNISLYRRNNNSK